MRRRLLLLLIVAVVVVAAVGAFKLAYKMGQSDGKNAAIANRNQFQTRVAGSGSSVAGASGAGQRGGAPTGGSPTTGTPAADGSARAGRGGNATGVAGRVTKIDGATLSVQQADNTDLTIITDPQTSVRKLATGTLADLKAGEFVAISGDRSGDTIAAKTVTGFGDTPAGGGNPGGGRPQGSAEAGAPAGLVFGQVRSIGLDGGSLTVQASDGTTLTVKTDPSTVVRTQQAGTVSDIKTGDMLLIQGDKTGTTAYTARTITDQGASSG